MYCNHRSPDRAILLATCAATLLIAAVSNTNAAGPVMGPPVTKITFDNSTFSAGSAPLPAVSPFNVYKFGGTGKQVTDSNGNYVNGTGNFFLSFSTFQLAAGDIAQFQGHLTTYKNIIARVTGGAPALIFGTIDVGSANLIFIDPNGVVVGTGGAILNGKLSPTSVVLTTADVVTLHDGTTVVSGTAFNNPVLSTSDPMSFGFMGKTLGAITLQNASLSLAETPTASLSLFGGNVDIQGTQLDAFGARINVASVTNGQITYDMQQPAGFTVSSDPGTILGDINISDASRLNVSTEGNSDVETAGTLQLQAQTIELLAGSKLQAITDDPATGGAGAISITAAGQLSVTSGSVINVGSLAFGGYLENGVIGVSDALPGNTPGTVTVIAGAVTLDGTGASGQTGILAQNNGGMTGGTVTITANSLTMKPGGEVDVSSAGVGPPGTITVNATGAVTGTGGGTPPAGVETGFFARQATAGGGSESGNINITAGSVALSDGAEVAASGSSGTTPAMVSVIATNDISISGTGSATVNPTGLFAPSSTGAGGTIIVKSTSGDISLADGAVVDAVSNANGVGGNVLLRARAISETSGSTVAADAPTGGSISITAARFTLTDSTVSARADKGYATKISLNSARILVTGSSTIDARSTDNTTNFGNLVVGAPSVNGTEGATFADQISGPVFGFTRPTGSGGVPGVPIVINSPEAVVGDTSHILTNNPVEIADRFVLAPITIPPVIAPPQTQVAAVCKFQSPDNVSTFTLQGAPVPGESIGPAVSHWTGRE